MNDPEALASMRATNRQILVFLAAVMAALLWAIILPDLVPSTARSNIGDVFHAAA